MVSRTRLLFLLSLLVWPSSPVSAAEKVEKARTDLYGDPLPRGAVARLGNSRFRAWFKG